MKRQIVDSPSELDRLENAITVSAQTALENLQRLLTKDCGLSSLAALKFSMTGCDPIDPARPLNFIEQLNQSFTYLASIAAARWLFEHHPENAPFVLNLGTMSGPDIASKDGSIVAETFAATHPDSNQKLKKDIAKLRMLEAHKKYVFFLSPVGSRELTHDGVFIIRLPHACLSG